jgi:hypothetical protein
MEILATELNNNKEKSKTTRNREHKIKAQSNVQSNA